MNLKALKTNFNLWLNKRLSSPEDSIEIRGKKNSLAMFLISGIPFLGTYGLLFWIFNLKQVATAMLAFTLFEILLAFAFVVIHRKTVLFALINQYFFVLFSFVCVLYFGGIMKSGGVVLIGLAGVLHSLYFLKPSQIRVLFIVYVASVVIEAFVQPLLVPIPEITPNVNLVLFVLHLFVIATVLQTWLSFFIQQSVKIKTKENEHLKELDKVKTNFYTNITHEFRTPLTVILGLTNPANKDSSSYFNNNLMIHKNGIRLLQLVDQMLNLSKLQAKAMQLKLIQSDILTYIRQLIEPLQHLANEKNIEIHYKSSLQELLMDFDPEKIDSLLNNLLSNAIKYSPPNSNIECTTNVCLIDSGLNHAYVVFPDKDLANQRFLNITIKDSGYGIKEVELPLIFDRFYQIRTNKLNENNGIGIGLLLVKEIVKLLDGNIFVSSTPDEGTKFVVILPISNEAELSAVPNYKEHSRYAHNTEGIHTKKQGENKNTLPILLIIEDNVDIANYLHSITSTYYNVIVANDGNIGIEIALKKIPDVIISDVLMPGKNGFEVCDVLKTDFRTSHIPIVLLSARVEKEAQIEGYKHNADAYITKPFDPTELLVRLQKLIEVRKKLMVKYKALALTPNYKQQNPQNPDEQFLIRTKEIVDRSFQDDGFDAIQLSEQLGMSRSQLFRKLKTLTGLSASNYIRYYRLSFAKELVLNTKLSFSEIAYEVGFKDPAYFTRSFHKEFGSSPSSCRNQL